MHVIPALLLLVSIVWPQEPTAPTAEEQAAAEAAETTRIAREGNALYWEGTRLYNKQQYSEAVTKLEGAIERFEQSIGLRGFLAIQALQMLGISHRELGHFERALEVMEMVVGIREAQFGEQNQFTLTAILELGTTHYFRGDYAAAVLTYRRAVAIAEGAAAPDKRVLGNCLSNLSNALMSSGRLEEALTAVERALQIQLEFAGPESPLTGTAYSNLAAVYRMLGRYADAEDSFRVALEIGAVARGADHLQSAGDRNGLGLVLSDLGRYAEAEAELLRAIRVQEEALGAEHPDTATLLLNLGTVYYRQDRFEEAAAIGRRALAIWETVFGHEHHNVSIATNNLALLVAEQGRLEEAAELFAEALAIDEKTRGPEHPGICTTINNLASTHQELGRLEVAEALLKRSLAIQEGALGNGHPNSATTLNRLADLSIAMRRPAEAETYVRESVAIQTRSLDLGHPHLVTSLTMLSRLLSAQGQFEEALELSEHALRTHAAFLDRELPLLPEADRFRLLDDAMGPGLMLAAATQAGVDDPGHLYETCYMIKGKATQMQAAGRAMAQRRDDPEVRVMLGRLRGLQKELSSLVFLPEDQRSEDHATQVAEKRRDRVQAERELNLAFDLESVLAAPAIEALAQAVPEGAVLVDYYVDEEVYAWVLRPGEAPALHSLGSVAGTLLRQKQASALAPLVARGGAPAGSSVDAGGLFAAIWQPLVSDIGEAQTVLVSPSGFLSELPFGVLRAPDGSFLLENHRFVYLNDATAITRLRSHTGERPSEALLLGPVDYGDRGESPSGPLDRVATRSPMSGSYPALPGTAAELDALESLYRESFEPGSVLTRLRGKEASEEALRAEIAGKPYVHIATHGYFEPDGLPSVAAKSRASDGPGVGEQMAATGLLPGLLSGLVLAGVNAEPEAGRDDGYLSAEEIQYLDLSACDLAVLSACETALGSARAGEGLMSLRRAFEVAGAKTVVSSLWKVDDRATATLMKHFYENYWLNGMGKAEALHQAKLRMLQQNRADFDGDARPETWGAFVLSGDWR